MAAQPQYQEAYANYIKAHENFKKPNFSQSLANSIINFNGAKGNLDQLYSENYVQQVSTLESQIKALTSSDIRTVDDYIKAVTDLHNTVGTLSASIQSSTSLGTVVNELYSRANQLQKMAARNRISLDSTTFQKNITFKGSRHKYVNVADLQKMYTRALNLGLGLFAEKLAVGAIQTDLGASVIQTSTNLNAEIENTLRSTLQYNSDLEGLFISGVDVTNRNKKVSKIGFGSNLTDIQLQANNTANIKGQVIYNVSAKQYVIPKGATSVELKGIATSIRRALLYTSLTATGTDVTTFYSLYRAMASAEFSNTSPLGKALTRAVAIPAIFGEGNDQLTDFFINGYLLPAEAIYNLVIDDKMDNVILRMSKLGARSNKDNYADQRTSEANSALYYLPYADIRSIAELNFEIKFKIPANLIGGN